MRLLLAGIWRESEIAFKRRVKRSTVFLRTSLVLLLLVMARHDPSNFSAQTGSRPLILDPGVSLSLCFSAQSARDLPDPGVFLRLFTSRELADSLYDLSKCCMLSICLLGMLKFLCRHTMYVSPLCFQCVYKPCIVGRESSMLPLLPLGSQSASQSANLLQNLQYIRYLAAAQQM